VAYRRSSPAPGTPTRVAEVRRREFRCAMSITC
jgi:hypothetical protein